MVLLTNGTSDGGDVRECRGSVPWLAMIAIRWLEKFDRWISAHRAEFAVMLGGFFDYPLLPKEIELGRATSIFSTSLIQKSLHNLNICGNPDSLSFHLRYISMSANPPVSLP